MTQEEKELLLKDLCARLPYGIKMTDGVDTYRLTSPFLYKYIEMGLKPYLRPMSSMTDAEGKEYRHLLQSIWDKLKDWKCSNLIDWLNAHHFDYRGLIEKGLALEAPKDMYEIKEK